MNENYQLEVFREYAKNILVASFIKETQIPRSIQSSKSDGKKIDIKKFNKELLHSIKELRKLVDSEQIKNHHIRNEIEQLSKKTNVSIGQAQKVINVYLKFYCLIIGGTLETIKELDCPLDSTTMEKRQRMKNILTMSEYIKWQDKFESEYKIRLFRDEEYDLNRLRNTFGATGDITHSL